MRGRALISQLLAFFAAALLVGTGVYLYVLWRNQTPQQVLRSAAGQVLYQANGMALGVIRSPNQAEKATLLRFTPDGGWVIAGQAAWLSNPRGEKYAKLVVIPNTSSGPVGAYWLCAVQESPTLDAIEVYSPHHPKASDRFPFHRRGIIEPVLLYPDTVLRGYSGGRVVFTVSPPRRILP